jgi:hypothetical protein
VSAQPVYHRTLESVLQEPVCAKCDHYQTSHCWSCNLCHGIGDRGKRCECLGYVKAKKAA